MRQRRTLRRITGTDLVPGGADEMAAAELVGDERAQGCQQASRQLGRVFHRVELAGEGHQLLAIGVAQM
jgi:hypothetical protein